MTIFLNFYISQISDKAKYIANSFKIEPRHWPAADQAREPAHVMVLIEFEISSVQAKPDLHRTWEVAW